MTLLRDQLNQCLTKNEYPGMLFVCKPKAIQSPFMQIKTPTMTKSSFKLIVLALLLVPMIASPQRKPSSVPANPVTRYGEASYSLSTSEQYLSTWLVAGP